MNPLKLLLIALMLYPWGIIRAQKVTDFKSSRCDYNNSRLYFHKKVRITSLVRNNDHIVIKFNAWANCSAKYKLVAQAAHDVLNLRLEPVPVETLPQPDGTVEYVYDASMCNCWFKYTATIQLASPQSIERFTLYGFPLKECFTPTFRVLSRGSISKGKYQSTPKLLPDEYIVTKGDTINRIDQYGARQGIHWKPGRMFFKFKDDQLQKIWWIRNDRFVELVYIYKNGKVVERRSFD
ncbi:hypothetical protein BKI52_20410 [marine bacterium AO1-C]|nr:hypothetical protein BKI52_20410 [marine bacterium AO1-C]